MGPDDHVQRDRRGEQSESEEEGGGQISHTFSPCLSTGAETQAKWISIRGMVNVPVMFLCQQGEAMHACGQSRIALTAILVSDKSLKRPASQSELDSCGRPT
jgi:hypothetical protein